MGPDRTEGSSGERHGGQPTPAADVHSTRNTLLRGLREGSLDRLAPRLRPARLSLHQTIVATGDRIATVYFPETAVLSEVVRLSDGSMAEVNIIGREGMFGLDAYFGVPWAGLDILTLVPGTALQLPLDDLLGLAPQDPDLRRRLEQYGVAIHNVRAIAAGCDRLHPVQTRLIRWLLRTHDRLDVDEFELTQDDLASLLGVARQTVTMSAGQLHDAGLIVYMHGHVRILDRPGLERRACECYWNIHTQLERLGLVAPRGGGEAPADGPVKEG